MAIAAAEACEAPAHWSDAMRTGRTAEAPRLEKFALICSAVWIVSRKKACQHDRIGPITQRGLWRGGQPSALRLRKPRPGYRPAPVSCLGRLPLVPRTQIAGPRP